MAQPSKHTARRGNYAVGRTRRSGATAAPRLSTRTAKASARRNAILDVVSIRCDGCAKNLTARISFIAKQSEFTPPVIYSLEERAKLVFLIEALPEQPAELRVGQPLDVSLLPQPAPMARSEAAR